MMRGIKLEPTENYLTCIKNRKIRHSITKLCISAHNLKIETGHHTRPKTPLASRKCDTCPDSIENELHVITECLRYLSFRKVLYTKVNDKDADFMQKNNTDKLVYLMRLVEPSMIKAFVHFIKNVENHRGIL